MLISVHLLYRGTANISTKGTSLFAFYLLNCLVSEILSLLLWCKSEINYAKSEKKKERKEEGRSVRGRTERSVTAV